MKVPLTRRIRELRRELEAQERPMHGGPVSPWPRRARWAARALLWLFSTVALGVAVAVVALVWVHVLGENGVLVVSLALLVMLAAAYPLSGVGSFTIAVAFSLLVVLLSHSLELAPLALLQAASASLAVVAPQASYWLDFEFLPWLREVGERLAH